MAYSTKIIFSNLQSETQTMCVAPRITEWIASTYCSIDYAFFIASQRSWGKAMFLQACACLQGGWVSLVPGPWMGGISSRGWYARGRGTTVGTHPPPPDMGPHPPHTHTWTSGGVPALIPTHGTQGRGWVSWDLRYRRQAGGTHPTGMLSCIYYLIFTVREPLQTIPLSWGNATEQ